MSVPINEMSTQGDHENDGGLLDSGASEVVRPYVYAWHQAIKEGKCGGRDVPVCLFGGVMKTGVVTQTGEVMIPRDRGEVQGYILPMTRVVEELGGAGAWIMVYNMPVHWTTVRQWIRDKLEEENIDLNHRPGKRLIADGLTKILPRELLEQFRSRAAMQSGKC